MSSYFTVTIFFLLHLALVLLCQCNAHDVATKVDQKHVINRQLSASIVSPTWPTTSTSPLCEAYAYIDSSTSATTKSSSPTFDFGEVTFYSEWKFNYLASITNTTLNSNSNIIDDANDLSSYEKGIQLALGKAQESYPNEKGYHDSLDSKLLAYSLATRAHSPQCEMYRILSRQALSHFNAIHKDNKDGIPSRVSLNAFVIIKGQITDYFTTVEQLIDLNKEQDTETKIMESSTDKISSYFGFSSSKKKENEKRQEYNNNNSTTEDSWASILPKEEIYNRSNKDVDKNHQHGKPIYILYGQFHTKEFASLFNYLNENNNSFVVRYMGYTNFEEEKSHTNEKEYQTTLQGYGVRVDIRNLEYKSFDEKETANSANVSSSSADDTNRKKQFDVEDTLNIDVIKDQWIDGIDPEILSSHALSPELQNFVKQYMPHLQSSNIDKFHLPIIPPRNELQDLSLAATTVIHQSVDPLWTMTQLSQNLPSHAYALCNVTIPDDLRIKTITKLNAIPIVQRSREDGIFQFYLNGRKMSVDRPSFNLFELLNVLREETSFVNQIYNVMKDYLPKQTKAMEIAVSLLSMGKDDFDKDEDEDHIGTESSNNDVLRIDVGRGYKGAILYLNDIEKDDDYAGWPSDVQHGLMNVQYGRPPTMRKNLLTILIVIDPFDSKGNFYIQILTFVFQLMQGMYPVRVGVLFASEQDINYCREKMSSDDMEKDQYCLKKRFNGDEDQALKQIATAQSLFALLLHVYQTHGGIIAINYIFGMLETLMTEDIKNINIDKIFQLHKQSLRMMRIPVSEDVSELMDQIRLGESNKAATTYEKAVKFAIKKNIKPGMAFVNGIPFSVDKPSDVNSIIQNEIQHLLGMIMEGKITNSKRSIYAKLLTGPNVYKQMHPLLTEENPQYRLTTSYFDDDTLISPKERIDSEPLILCEAVIDFGNEAGLKLAESFLQSMKRKVEITKGSNHVNLSFRLLPSDGSSAQSSLGKIFQQANKFGIDSLISITQAYQMVMLNGKESTGDALLSQMDNLPEKELIGKILGTSNECPELPWEKSAAGSISANGRVYFTASITTDDIEVLIDLAYKSAKTITNKLRNEMQYDKTAYIAIARLASFVSYTFANSKSSTIRRADPLVPFRDIISEQSSDNNMFFYSWNGKSTEAPKVCIQQRYSI
jgi:UDP-glucose:glycoprotein glucosyltransferase